MKTVAVLMSTYNGEKYLKEQIDSILEQRDVEVTLFIRDDGSKDGTLAMINQYVKNCINIKLVKDKNNLGPGMSFLTLLKHIIIEERKFDFYAFADQDDIWLDNKLKEAVKLIPDSNNVPTLYCSNQLIYKNDNIEGERFRQKPEICLKSQITRNLLYGCTFVFNLSLASLVVESGFPDKGIIACGNHDAWLVLVALLLGQVVYDQKAYIKYRLHGNNLVGIHNLTVKERITRVVKEGYRRKNLRMKRAKSLRTIFAGQIKPKDKIVLDEFADYKKSLHNRIQLMLDKSVTSVTGENHFFFMLKVMVGFV